VAYRFFTQPFLVSEWQKNEIEYVRNPSKTLLKCTLKPSIKVGVVSLILLLWESNRENDRIKHIKVAAL
jgi:hypothetical protein